MNAGLKLALRAAAGLACAAALVSAAPAQAPRAVDLALVLAVDISGSMDEEEQDIQRQGYVDAFKHSAITGAIRNGAVGRIAVAYVEWSEDATVVVDWTLVGNVKEAAAFADNLRAQPLNRGRRTSISLGLTSSKELFDKMPFTAMRKVIDISGDGANNSGEQVDLVRDRLVADGVIINGLPLMLKPPRPNDVQDLEAYYRECVKGGRGSFVLGIHSLGEMAGTIRNKLITEIADLGPREGPFIPAQAAGPPTAPKVDCANRYGGYGGFNGPRNFNFDSQPFQPLTPPSGN
jgi:hypothetical protein